MKKLQFIANCEQQGSSMDSDVTQSLVAELLVDKLSAYGFEALPQSGDQIAVTVDEHSLPLSVTCHSKNEDGRLVCEITSYPDEEQDWVQRITERSLLNQLAQAVESSLKEDESYSEFSWKG